MKRFRRTGSLSLSMLVLLLYLSLPTPAVAGGSAAIALRVDRLADEHGSVLYAAVHSLEPCQDILAGIEPVPGWRGYRPGGLPIGRERAGDIRQALKAKLNRLNGTEAEGLLKRLQHWCALESVLISAIKHYRGYSLEKQMAVFFALPRTRALFGASLQARGLHEGSVRPARIGASLSSQEMTSALYSVLDTLSAWPEEDQLAYVADFYETWPAIRIQ